MTKALTDTIRARLLEIDVERDHLVALLRLYESGAERNGTASVAADTDLAASLSGGGGSVGPSLYAPKRGGATDRIIDVVTQLPGLAYSEVVERAKEGLQTTADDPRRSLGSTLQSLVKRGRIVRKEGKHYIAAR